MQKILVTIFVFIAGLFFSQINTRDSIRLDHYAKGSIPAAKPQAPAKVIQEIERVNAPAKKVVTKLNPTKAGLYSAVLPGLGQAYNKKYWKIPIVWGAVGTGVGIAIWNQNKYKEYREYYIAKLNGTPNEFLTQVPYLDAVALGNAQDRAKRQRDYAIAISGLIYILNIVDAVVDAHLYEGRKDPDLSLAPAVIYDDYNFNPPKTGLALTYRF